MVNAELAHSKPVTTNAVALPFHVNILDESLKNDAYRHVLFTGARTQLVVMTIPPGGNIGLEAHPHVEQLLFVARGVGKAILDGVETSMKVGSVVVATPGARHDIVNTGNEALHLYTVYAPANHLDGRLHATKEDAEADERDEAFGATVGPA
jgi:mannose-6-phosphate isomerase-like protein (cupin superfamily)